ncbi:aminopeptidase [Oceanidesulfovibrio marinus]|uniref:M18 family aminopeptidase n=1 Tax=Oceanidesulfovibrio marinus TaxID=370038 RepID=A0A6P1ZG72_9BACT|nr:aminopeptidase [Oceanidesulfovibrio marinus]TVM33635.1 aminopeptidase [Oceanidesulfovibrio marinus]
MSDTPLFSSTKSCWETYASDEHRAAMDDTAVRYLDFLTRCKTEREVVAYVSEKAAAAGFSDDPASGKYMRVFHDKTILLARRGSKDPSHGFRLVGAHGDCPRIDLKQHPLYEEVGVGLAKTHYYGGVRKYQWLSRPLAIHGVIVKTDGEVVRVVLGEADDEPCFCIADLLPHLAQKQSEQKLSEAFDAEKLSVIMGHEPLPKPADGEEKKSDTPEDKDAKSREANPVKAHILEILRDKYGIAEEDLYSAELQAVPAGPARFVGLDRALLGGYGHDDRINVFAGLEAMLSLEDEPEHCQIAIFWDKEEIGSDGSTGAKSRFMEYCVQDLIDAWSPGASFGRVMENTKAISADTHAAIDPDYQELHEKLNAALIGHGPTFCKFTGHRGKYMANDAHPEYVAWLRRIVNEAGIPWQMAELGKVDQGGGGTVAKHLAEYGMDIIDMGPPVLSMHGPFELASKADLYATVLVLKTFFAS